MPEDREYDARRELLGLLLEKVQADPYPSSTMLDIIEDNLTSDEIPAYARVLLDKIRGDRFPSFDLVNRVAALG